MNAAMEVETPHVLQNAGVVAKGNQHHDSTALLISVEDVIVTERYRQDLGDLDDLVSSIVEVGLLNPITVREWHGGYRLVAGERRLTAFKQLGLSEIPARVAHDIANARDALVAERDENTARKEMLPSEKAALGLALEEMEKPAALKRMLAGTPRVPGPEGNKKMRPRDIAAEAIGMGESTYRRLKTVVTLSKDETQPAAVREAARNAVDAIDAGGSIRGEYYRVKEVRDSTRSGKSQKEASEVNSRSSSDLAAYFGELAEKYPTYRTAFEASGHARYDSESSFEQAARRAGAKWRFTERQYAKHAAQSQDRLNRSSMSIEVAIDVLSHIDFSTITPEQAAEALQRIDVRSQLGFYIRSLKEITNE